MDGTQRPKVRAIVPRRVSLVACLHEYAPACNCGPRCPHASHTKASHSTQRKKANGRPPTLPRGIPVYVFEIRHLDSRTIATYEKSSDKPISRAPQDGTTPPKMMRLFALYENLTRFAQPLATQLVDDREFPDTPVTMSTNIVDVSGVSLRMFWNLKGHMQAASQLATAHYPETLDRIFVRCCPIFSPPPSFSVLSNACRASD